MNRLASRAAAVLAAGFLCAAASAQQPYTLDEQLQQSNFTFSGDTSLGPILGNPSNQFRIDGIIDLLLTPSGANFSTGEFTGGHLYTDPSTLNAKIPNPIPFLPPLATIDIVDPVYVPDSAQFPVNPADGTFSATVVLTATNGFTRTTYLGITTISTLIGESSDPTPISGKVYNAGTQTILDSPIDSIFHSDDPVTGISSDVHLVGRILAGSDSVNKPMVLRVGTLTAGLTGTFSLTQGTPNASSFLYYSVAGLGSTTISSLSVTLGIRNAIQAGPPRTTNGVGATTWNLPVPANASGTTARLQAAQNGKISNIWLTTVL